MIVSHRHKLIFLHSRKTAGSSVSVSLLRYLDADDWWLSTPAHGVMNDALRAGIAPAPVTTPHMLGLISEIDSDAAGQLVTAPAELTRDERMTIAAEYNATQPDPPDSAGWQHVTAANARELVGDEAWDSYFKISFERNPWDRVVSLYWWRIRQEREGETPFSFREFVEAMHSGDPATMRRYRAQQHSNWDIYAIDGDRAVDQIGRYENLTDDLTRMLGKVGIDFDGWLPQSKGSIRQARDLDELYDDKLIDLVGEIFHREIDLLGYTYPQ